MSYNVLIATHPFGACGQLPIDRLEENKWKIHYNTWRRRLKADEVKDMLVGMDAVIAGTEPYNKETLEKANDLKVISRVGVGLDNIDFETCEKKGIIVTYTPEAPADGVADLTLGQIINLFRGIPSSDKSIREGRWSRVVGSLVSEKKIGVLGVGRIGGRVVKRLKAFDVETIYACDHVPKDIPGVEWMTKSQLFETCDLVTIHIPLNEENYHCVGHDELRMMKGGSFVINTSRGPVLDEKALKSLIVSNHLAGAALDVFEQEPYRGPLTGLENVLLTAHIGSSVNKSRFLMEDRAAEDCARVLKGMPPLREASQ